MTGFNVCPSQQCRGRTDHSTLRHWTPVYLVDAAYIVTVHAKGTCVCKRTLLGDLTQHTWDTIRYFAREGRQWLRWRWVSFRG